MSENEINNVRYPGEPDSPKFDNVENWPATTKVTQNTGEDITRNRDALLIIERILGPNPHIGLFTSDVRTASIAQRLSVLEQGVSEGRFEFKRLKVENAINTIRSVSDALTLVLGAPRTQSHEYTQVEFQGPIRVLDSGASDPRTRFDVGFVVEKEKEGRASTESEIRGSSSRNKPLLLIEDFNRGEINDRDHRALEIRGNLFVSGYIDGNFALDHERLNNINTDPVIDAKGNVIVDAIHVSRGNYHSHKRGRYDTNLGRWIVDPNPQEATYGIIDHNDLEPQSTRTSIRQRNFVPDPNVAYHVTNGDEHDHVGGDGAPLRHKFLLGTDPKKSNHVTNGDFHRHDPDVEDGGLIPTHGIVLQTDLESSVAALSTDVSSDPVVAEEDLSALLTRIANRFTANDEKNAEQDDRLDEQRSELEQAKVTRQEFNQVRSEVSNAVQQVTELDGELETTNTNVENNAEAILLVRQQVSAAMFATTVTALTQGSKVYGIGGGGGSTGTITSFDGDVTYIDDTDTTSTTRTTNVTFNSGTVAANLAGSSETGSTIVPRDGVLRNLYVRASSDLADGSEIAVTVFVNFEPSILSVSFVHQDTTDVPEAVGDTTGEVEVSAGDFITFEFFNKGSVDLSGTAVAAALSYYAPIA